MIRSPGWWQEHCPRWFAIIDPATLPAYVSDAVFVKEGYLPMCWEELRYYEKLSEDRSPAAMGSP
jgi:hypothetical protein